MSKFVLRDRDPVFPAIPPARSHLHAAGEQPVAHGRSGNPDAPGDLRGGQP